MTINSIVPSLIKSYKGKNIRINPVTKYVCLSDMATASGKLVADWLRLNATSKYLEAFQEAMGIPIAELLEVTDGNSTWAHQKIAIRFAQWCSPKFAIQVDFWIDELMTTGTVELAPSLTHLLAIEKVQAIESAFEALTRIEQKCVGQPRRAQLIADLMMNLIVEIGGQPQIAPSAPQLRGVVDIANEMGYSTDMSSRVKLGNHVANSGHQKVKEKRFCNGEMRDINCYSDTPELRSSIAEFFN
jgi:hypothetical protein